MGSSLVPDSSPIADDAAKGKSDIAIGISSKEILLSLIEKISETLTHTIGVTKMRLVYKFQLTGVFNMDVIKGYNRVLYHMFAHVLEEGLKSGEFKTILSQEDLTKHFVMAIRGLSYEWCIRHPEFDLKKQSLEHFELLLKGIKA